MKQYWLAAGAAMVVLTGAALAGLAARADAQEPDPTPAAEQGARRGVFLERVAEQLGIASDELEAAVQAAALDAVDDAEANGNITAEQADKARGRIESGQGPRGFLERRHDRREHRRDFVRKAILESAADAIGITFDELRAELQSGDSIADVAGEQGVTLDAVKAAITAGPEAKLDEAVANGRITQERADKALARLTEDLDEILDRSKEPAATP